MNVILRIITKKHASQVSGKQCPLRRDKITRLQNSKINSKVQRYNHCSVSYAVSEILAKRNVIF
jgi:hypothetical protein